MFRKMTKAAPWPIPISVIRKSDGENVVLGYLNIKGIKTIKYFKKMRHFNINFLNFSFQKILRKELLESFYEADFVGVPIQEYYHGYTSSVRKFEMSITDYFNFDVRKYVDNHFQLEFVKNPENNKLKNEYAQKLISNKKIGLISHFKLDDFLADHNSTVVAQTKIPKRDLRDKIGERPELQFTDRDGKPDGTPKYDLVQLYELL